MKLELKHLVGYLPYGIKMQIEFSEWNDVNEDGTYILNAEIMRWFCFEHDLIKPILRPITEMESYFKPLFGKDEEVTNFLNAGYLDKFDIEIYEIKNIKAENLPYGLVQLLYKHHFDIHNLIPNNLAIDKNKL